MSLEKKYVRDGKRQIIASVTKGFGAETSIVRDSEGAVTGRTTRLFNTSRNNKGDLVSINSADPGFLIPKKK